MAVAALEEVVRGLEAFEHDVADLKARREGLVTAAVLLDADVRGAGAVPPDPEVAARLRSRHDDLVRDVTEALDAVGRTLNGADGTRLVADTH